MRRQIARSGKFWCSLIGQYFQPIKIKEIVDTALNLLVNGKFDLEGSFIIASGEALLGFLNFIQKIDSILQAQETFIFTRFRVIPAPNDLLTPFYLRGQTFRVNVELSTYYYGHIQNIIFRAERLLLDIYK